MSTTTVAVVTASPLLHACWQDALVGAVVHDVAVSEADLGAYGLVVFDLPSISQLRDVLDAVPGDGPPQRRIWVHADLEPTDVRRARRVGVTRTVHRSLGLAGVRVAIADESDDPRISMLGRIRDDGALDRLTEDEMMLLQRLGSGATVAQLRQATGWSRHEVERLRVSALAKLGVQTTGEALAITVLAAHRRG
jgi:hypothetical protein